MLRRQILGVSLLVVMLAANPLDVLGQAGQASPTGTVVDPQGAVVPGARITAAQAGTAQAFATITMTDGSFNFPAMQPGQYTVVVEAPGFKKLEKAGVILNAADRQTTGALVLDVGAPTETVNVIADSGELQLKSASAEIGEVVTGRQVRDLALNRRNVLDLMKTIPGVVVRTGAQVAGNGFELANFSINGARTNQHNMTIDGSSNVDTGSNGSTHIMIGIDAIAEFKVLTSNYQAEYGRSVGGGYQDRDARRKP